MRVYALSLSLSPRGYLGVLRPIRRPALKHQSESSSDRSFFPVFRIISGLHNTEFLKIHRSLALWRDKKTETETEFGGRIHRIVNFQ